MANALATTRSSGTPDGYIVGPGWDLFFFLLSPLFALGIGAGTLRASPEVVSVKQSFIAVFVLAHVLAGCFRAYGDPAVFHRFRFRFTLIPLAALILMAASPVALALGVAAVAVWDVHHSSAQTFGLARIYDARHGNDPRQGRSLDLLLNYLLYAGPILAGATLLSHLDAFYGFVAVGDTALTSVPAWARVLHPALGTAVVLGGALLVTLYVLSFRRFTAAGYKVAPQKLLLYATTAMASTVSWGALPFLEAVFVMKLFHSLQYFGLVAWSEGRRAGSAPLLLARLAAPALLFGSFGTAMRQAPEPNSVGLALLTTITLLHFWSDGFMWSVRKKAV